MSFPAIILFGDSLTERSFSAGGFGASLANDYHRRADVLNRGLSGYNSRWLLPFVEAVVEAQVTEVLFFVVLIGTNDAVLPGFVHHVPLEEFKSNLKQLVKTIRTSNKSKHSRILLATPPPIDLAMLREFGPRAGNDRSVQHTRAYADAVLDVAHEISHAGDDRITVTDFHAAIVSRKKGSGNEAEEDMSFREYLIDGLHLSQKGYEVLYTIILETVKSHWPDLLPDNVRMMAPWWGHLDAVKQFNTAKEVEHGEL